MSNYDPAKIEIKWQNFWEKKEIFKSNKSDKKKYFVLEMFPYPSGKLHMGHVRNYSLGDVIARYKIMNGYSVLHPMGWDAFGLPAENAAIKNNTPPAQWTYNNIDYMRVQLKRLGLSYDWEREIATCNPEYYKWEQKIFTEMYKKGIAYKKSSHVNWCPTCNTVLANEQVSDGSCWRCKTPVESKTLEQWFFKITDYVEELLADIEKLKGWPQEVLTMQKNWIGKSYGAEVNFPLEDGSGTVNIFTTRPDTIYGVTFMSIAPEHPLALELSKGTKYEQDVQTLINKTRREDIKRKAADDYEKEGVFTGKYAINPVNGKKIPIFVANFVLMEYGTGAVMAVPAHDQRDFEFAKKYDIPIIVVITPKNNILEADKLKEAFVDNGILINSEQFNGLDNSKAKEEIVKYLDEKKWGKSSINYRIRDWGISRQRYWGTPIPIIYCNNCGVVPVPEEQLPVKLPENVDFSPEGGSPLAKSKEFVNVQCPVCGKPAKRETDTMDTFVESSWYYLRYTDPKNNEQPFDKDTANYWMSVDQYIGGVEHAVMHLLYARFFTKVLRDLGYVDIDEPFNKLLTQGMVLKEGSKMDKSRGNIVSPNEIIDKFGADTARLFILFAAPPEKSLDWSDTGVEGSFRFINRIWRYTTENMELFNYSWQEPNIDTLGDTAKELYRLLNFTIKKVSEDIESFHLNTAIASIMEFSNYVSKLLDKKENIDESVKMLLAQSLRVMVLLLSPFVPHASEELWSKIGKEKTILDVKWPSYNKKGLIKDEELIIVQVNGKVRAKLTVNIDISDNDLRTLVLENRNVNKHIANKEIRKFIIVPHKIVNIVV